MAQKRSIFEDVGTAKAEAPKPAGGVIDRARSGARGAVRLWLMALFGLVVLMIAVGGLTRLTDSGLSITEWAPITGAIPPMSAEDWERTFVLVHGSSVVRKDNGTLDYFARVMPDQFAARRVMFGENIHALDDSVRHVGSVMMRRDPARRAAPGLRPSRLRTAARSATPGLRRKTLPAVPGGRPECGRSGRGRRRRSRAGCAARRRIATTSAAG